MNNSNIKIKTNCIYWLDANKIISYYGKILTKTRPFICFYSQKINNVKYYYFISGTSKTKNEIKIKQFLNYFVKVSHSKINNLSKDTLFQSNVFYIISEHDLHIFNPKFIGKSNSEIEKDIKNMILLSKNDKVWLFMLFSNYYNDWSIMHAGSNFLYISSRHKKKKNELKIIIGKNIKNGKNKLKNIEIDIKRMINLVF